MLSACTSTFDASVSAAKASCAEHLSKVPALHGWLTGDERWSAASLRLRTYIAGDTHHIRARMGDPDTFSSLDCASCHTSNNACAASEGRCVEASWTA